MEFFLIVIILAFIFELTDSAAGMGFGTGLTPLLFILGYTPLQVVPALLISETMSGFIDAYFDHELKNVQFNFRPMSDATKIVLGIGFFGCIAIFISIILGYFAIRLSNSIINIYVAVLVLMMGVFGLIRLRLLKYKSLTPKPKLLIAFAALAGFNKGVGGGGYGPVITMGEIFSGIYEKSATAIVSFSEAIVSLTGVFTFFLISNAGVEVDLILLPSILTGAFLSALFTPYIVRVIPNKAWKFAIPIYAFGIGIYSLLKTFGVA